MKKVIVILIFFCFLTGCAWSKTDKVLFGMSAVGALGDAITTIDAKRDPNLYERNKVINWHKHNDTDIF